MLFPNIAQPGPELSDNYTGDDKYPSLRKSAFREGSGDAEKRDPDAEVPTLTRQQAGGYEIDPELERKVMYVAMLLGLALDFVDLGADCYPVVLSQEEGRLAPHSHSFRSFRIRSH